MGENLGLSAPQAKTRMDEPIRIEPLLGEQIPSALALVKAVFDEFEAPDYPQEGVQEFYTFLAPGNIATMQAEQRLRFWGAFEDNALVGVLASRTVGHICLLFVDKAYHRKGIARKLFDAMLCDCRAQSEPVRRITVNSSPYAVEAYKHLGFAPTSEEQIVNGIRFVPMTYPF